MKIAMMTNNYKPFIGGVPISVERLAKGLRDRGHEVYIFAPEYENADQDEDRENGVIRYDSWKGMMEGGVVIPNMFDAKIRDAFKKQRFDLIHVHHPMLLGNVASHLSIKYDIPLVFTYHTKYEEYLHYIDTFAGMKMEAVTEEICRQGKKVIPWYMKKYLKHCDMVFAPSVDIYDYVKSLKPNALVHVVPTGMPKEAFMKDDVAANAIRRRLLQDKKYLLCTVSRLEKEKNQYFLMDAMKRLKEEMGDCFRFVFVGDGNERKALELYAEKNGLKENVLFVGCVPNEEVKNYLNASDAFLFSSKSETQGIVILEAMAAGLPVAALDATGVRDIVENGENGFLVDDKKEDDSEEYAKQVKRLLTDRKIRENLSKNAKETALFYHSDTIARRAEAFYLEMLSNERSFKYGEYTYCRG